MDHIKAEIIKKFGDIRLEELTGGYTNKVYLLKGTDPEIVIKIMNNENKDYTEIKCLELLNHTSVTPKIHEILKVDHTSVIFMEYISGINSQRILDRNDWGSARNIYAQLGRHLVKDIHNIKYHNQIDDIPLVGLDILERLDELRFIPEKLVEKSKEWLSQLELDNYVLVHGDYGPHNTIYSDEKLVIIDWEWGRWGSPLTDISWVYWFVHLHYSNQASSLFSIFLESYLADSQIKINSTLLKVHAIERVWNVLFLLNGTTEVVQTEWINRLKWTLENDFFY